MNWWIKFGCFLTGWNRDILSISTEASYKQLKKYTSAILILIILWSFIGYCFADIYIETPWWGSVISAIIFVIIIVQIERQIILNIGKNKLASIFRILIAILMAILGSTIVDQIIFKDDINKKMIELIDLQVVEQLPHRLNIIETKLENIQLNIDSLTNINIGLNDEISKKPTITTYQTSTNITNTQKKLDDGTYETVPQKTIQTVSTPIPNPRIEQVKINNESLALLRNQHETYFNQKIDIENTLRAELREKKGFLEELDAMFKILKDNPIAIIFYSILFLFLIFLELFVLVSKYGDECDYYKVIIHQLEMKEKGLKELAKK